LVADMEAAVQATQAAQAAAVVVQVAAQEVLLE
jgi:hypothetical protein